jgi:hypothetical protein
MQRIGIVCTGVVIGWLVCVVLFPTWQRFQIVTLRGLALVLLGASGCAFASTLGATAEQLIVALSSFTAGLTGCATMRHFSKILSSR